MRAKVFQVQVLLMRLEEVAVESRVTLSCSQLDGVCTYVTGKQMSEAKWDITATIDASHFEAVGEKSERRMQGAVSAHGLNSTIHDVHPGLPQLELYLLIDSFLAGGHPA